MPTAPTSTARAAKTGLSALLTPDDCALLLIDHQPFQFAGLWSHPNPRGRGWNGRGRGTGARGRLTTSAESGPTVGRPAALCAETLARIDVAITTSWRRRWS